MDAIPPLCYTFVNGGLGESLDKGNTGGVHMPRFRYVAGLGTLGLGVASLGVFSMAAGAGADPVVSANTTNIAGIHTGNCSPVQSVQDGNIINANANGAGAGGRGG